MNSGQDILQSMIEKHKIISKSPEDTFALGKQIGESVAPGSVLTLVGDLGVGKTVFTQGLAEGLRISDAVNSPTFTIVQIYEEGRIPLYHLVYTGSVIFPRWMKSGMRIIFTEMGYA